MQRHNIKVAIAIIKYNHCSSVSAAVGVGPDMKDEFFE